MDLQRWISRWSACVSAVEARVEASACLQPVRRDFHLSPRSSTIPLLTSRTLAPIGCIRSRDREARRPEEGGMSRFGFTGGSVAQKRADGKQVHAWTGSPASVPASTRRLIESEREIPRPLRVRDGHLGGEPAGNTRSCGEEEEGKNEGSKWQNRLPFDSIIQ